MRQSTAKRRRVGPIGDLVRAIETYQTTHGLTDQEVARRLGMPRTTWNNARIGLFRPGLGFARKAATVAEFREAAERVLMPSLDSLDDTAAAS